MRSKAFFLTYPQCPLSKEILSDYYNKVLLNGQKQLHIICEEEHKDGSPHLHAYIKFETVFTVSSASFYDIPVKNDRTYHPNVQTVRSPAAVVRYIRKGGKLLYSGITDLEMDMILAKGVGKLAAVAERIATNPAAYDEVIAEDPSLMLSHHSGMKALRLWAINRKMQQSIIPIALPDQPIADLFEGGHTAEHTIYNWLSTNMYHKRPFKAPQLWIWSPQPNTGKTSLVRALAKLYRRFEMPFNSFVDGYDDASYDLITFDDYSKSTCKTISFLKRFLQGDVLPLNQKGTSSMKHKNLPVIFTSNFSPQQIYSKVDPQVLRPLLVRLLIVQIPVLPPFFPSP